ncbi:16S rRNA (uracil(1498)-N(3))-methyltransferase [Glaciibacter superstes]|uniref:16S rRNA (uracil(1498)-N(3))-methyltransferase n=1 Tax=Glaciibacter superstes TaxID=501023 RepID=UPI0003B6E18D|nr:16S rRNA (uracil(1498)-N(3))-methyltransferase [Glaciibacter superstes]
MAHFFLDESLDPGECTPGSTVSIGGTEARHAVTVSRVREGERLLIGNGSGLMVSGTVAGAAATELRLVITEARIVPAPSRRITLVQALAKGDRDELAVQAATELGIDEVVPWSASRSVSRWEGAKRIKGRNRWTSIVREAAKQSIRAWLPSVAGLATTNDLARRAAGSRMLVLEPTASVRLTALAIDSVEIDSVEIDSVEIDPLADFCLVVGPEGGITPAELEALTEAGALAVRLGDTVLRTSTAGPAALAVLNQSLGRW